MKSFKIPIIIILSFVVIVIISIYLLEKYPLNVKSVETSVSSKRSPEVKPDKVEYLNESEISFIYSDTKRYIDKYVKMSGRVFQIPEYINGAVALQVFTDIENSDNNTIIYYYNNDVKIKNNDYVKFEGYIYDELEGENAFGGIVKAPIIVAEKFEISSYKDIVSPTIKEVLVNKTINKKGVEVIIEKVEFAEKETRVYVKIINNSGYEYNLYKYSGKIVQNSKQYEITNNYSADYKEIQSEILSGVETDGILVFPNIEIGNFKIILTGNSDNWNLDIKPFEFNIQI